MDGVIASSTALGQGMPHFPSLQARVGRPCGGEIRSLAEREDPDGAWGSEKERGVDGRCSCPGTRSACPAQRLTMALSFPSPW